MQSLLLERFGTQMSDAHTLIVSVSAEGPRVLLLGLEPPSGEALEFGGLSAHPLFPRHPNDNPQPGVADVWAVPVEGGLALFERTEDIEDAAGPTSLASTSGRMDAMARLLGSEGAGMVLGAIIDGEVRENIASGFPVEPRPPRTPSLARSRATDSTWFVPV